MHMKLELVPVPVVDIDRSKAFYAERVGFIVDLDERPVDGLRIVQLTPPGLVCSIVLSTALPQLAQMVPSSVRGLQEMSWRTGGAY